MKNTIKKRNQVPKHKKLWIYLILALISVIAIIYVTYYTGIQNNIDLNKENLQILANEKSAQINKFFEYQKEKLTIISSMNVFKEAVLYPDDTAKIELAKNRINELKETIPGISLLSSEGIVSVGDVDLPKTDYRSHPYFTAKREDTTLTEYYDPLRKEHYYAIIGPIYDNENKLIGRIAFDILLKDLDGLVRETFKSDTCEVYLINSNGLLLSASSYIGQNDKEGILIQEIKSKGAIECLKDLEEYQKEEEIEEQEEVTQYVNYMGDDVFGARGYVPIIGGCVIAEKKLAEIKGFSPSGYVVRKLKKEVKDEN